MRRSHFASVLFVLLVCLIVAIGFSRDWFKVSSAEDPSRNEVHVNLTLDRGKFQSDTEKATEKTREEASHVSDSIKGGAWKLDDRIHDKTPNQ